MKVRKTEYGTYNENFFNEDNELTFYWAGYIASKAKNQSQ
jgi:hypothetical protein